MIQTFLDAILYDLTALIVIIDPPGVAAIFAAMTARENAATRAGQAARASLIALIVLAAFALLGTRLLGALGIGLPALRISGGILLFLAAADMVTGTGAARAATTSDRDPTLRPEEDISVFPLAIPLIAGPGAMTTVIVLHAQAASHAGSVAPRIAALFAAIALSVAATFACLRAARIVSRLLGGTGANVIGRVLGVLLAALAAQITLDGLRQSLFR